MPSLVSLHCLDLLLEVWGTFYAFHIYLCTEVEDHSMYTVISITE